MPKSNVYELGSEGDVATASENAQNTVVLKIDGDLTINSGVTLTTVKSSAGYGGPKGLIIYCTGKMINNGTVSMTARGAKAEGQNVYLLRKSDGSYAYVPKLGASGGNAQNKGGWDGLAGTSGGSGTQCGTGRWRFWSDYWRRIDYKIWRWRKWKCY